MFSCLTPVVFCWKMSESRPEWNVVSFGSCSRITLWCCTAKIMHNNNHIYTYIRSQGDNLSTPQISKQLFFTTANYNQRESGSSLAASQQTGHDFPNMARWLCNQPHGDKQPQTATNRAVVSSPVHPSGNTRHVTNKYSCKTTLWKNFTSRY